MTNQYQALAVNKVDLLEALKAARDIGEYRRLQAVHLRDSLGLPVKAIAAATGFSESHVKNAHSAYRRGGIEALRSKSKGGRYHAHLTEAEEKAFIAPFVETARSGGILEVGSIHRALEWRLGKTLNVQVTYAMLHRHGWRKIAPRPHHPQGDAAASAAFKKTGRAFSRRRKKKPPE